LHRSTIVRAELVDDNICTAQGLTVTSPSPILAMCRRLIEVGVDPGSALHVYRSDVLAISVVNIAIGARLTIKTAGNGAPTFALEPSVGGAGGSPVAPIAAEARQ
jgi:Fe2+ transport system protein FeoA